MDSMLADNNYMSHFFLRMGDFTFSTEPNANYNVEEPKADGEYAQQVLPVEAVDQCQNDIAINKVKTQYINSLKKIPVLFIQFPEINGIGFQFRQSHGIDFQFHEVDRIEFHQFREVDGIEIQFR